MLWQELNDYESAPWRGLETLQNEMNRLFTSVADFSIHHFPAVNVWADSEENMLVTAELPGIRAEDMEISVQGNTLRLSGSRKAEEPREGRVYLRRERSGNGFTRIVRLPFHVDADKVEAGFKNGLLKIVLPRSEEDKPRKIDVKTA